ncbi:TetR/AcrR family transcriptional regulator [Streptomyces sp. NBC_01476]|uniref:TetR/AcrR family transcriptional regulator n=1 Tax=Streptomyces sp. NBC_01476 TaxID=2903881 RepID=UPI002E301438|nr:TetR/AcrR family transcriptional regulator [Streptomyces sp. NBC_01476]
MARTREFDTTAAVEAAMAAFRRTGYEGTSIQDLVEATGLGRGSIYGAFGSKEGLYLAALDLYRERFARPLVELLQEGAPARELIREVLVGAVDEIVRDGSRHACLIVGAATERAHLDLDVRDRLRDTARSLEAAFFEVIVRAQESGELPGRRGAADLARFLVTSLQGLRVMGAIEPDRAALTASAEVALAALD